MLYLKGKPWELGGKGARCGFTSKPLSRTTDDCHPWHSNLCHGQMTTFILSVDRHVILKRFREEAQLFFHKSQEGGVFLVLSHVAFSFDWSQFHYYLGKVCRSCRELIYLKLFMVQPRETWASGWFIKRKDDALNWTNKHDSFLIGQRSHMLLKLSCLSN